MLFATGCAILLSAWASGTVVVRLPKFARIHRGAEPGHCITEVKAYRYENGVRSSVHSLSIQDHGSENVTSIFKLNETTHCIENMVTIKDPISTGYHVYISVDAVERRLTILVSAYNYHRPHFRKDQYNLVLMRTVSPGSVLAYIEATDADKESYNRYIQYGMTGEISSCVDVDGDLMESAKGDISDYFSNRGGFLSATRALPNRIKECKVQLQAVDGGWPTRSGNSVLQLQFTNMSEPRDLRLTNNSFTTAWLCWNGPDEGNIEGYVVEYYKENTNKDETKKLTYFQKDDTCGQLRDLQPEQHYICTLYATDNVELSMPSREVSVKTSVTGQCEPELQMSGMGAFAWPQTQPDKVAKLACPYGGADGSEHIEVDRQCSVSDDGIVQWDKAAIKGCKLAYVTSAKEATEMLDSIHNLTASDDVQIRVTVEVAEEVTEQLWKTTRLLKKHPGLAYDILEVVSELTNANEDVRSEFGMELVDVIESMADKIEDLDVHTEKVELKRMPVQTVKDLKMQNEVVIDFPSDLFGPETTEGPAHGRVEREAGSESPSVLVAAYSDSALFQDTRNCYRNQAQNSPVMTAKVLGQEVHSLPDNKTVDITFKTGIKDPKSKAKPRCVYWDRFTSTWQPAGVYTNLKYGNVICKATHLSSFSILLDMDPNTILSCEHQEALTRLSYIGSIVSCTALFLTMLLFWCCRLLRQDDLRKILHQLCGSLLCLNLTYFVASRKNEIESTTCHLAAVTLHYFLLSSLNWMTIEAFELFRLLAQLLRVEEEDYFMLKRMVWAWGTPVIPIIITLTESADNYRSQDFACHVTNERPVVYYLAYILPAAVLIIFDMLLYLVIARNVLAPYAVLKFERLSVNTTEVIGAFATAALLGSGWLLGLFAIRDAKLMFHYMFCIATSFQGLLIFTFRCLLSSEVHRAVREAMHRFICWCKQKKTGNCTQEVVKVATDAKDGDSAAPKDNNVGEDEAKKATQTNLVALMKPSVR